MKTSKIVKITLLSLGALVCVGGLIGSNVAIKMYQSEINSVFSGGTYGEVNSELLDTALELGDGLMEDIVEDSIVLLKNQNNSLPLAQGTKLNFFGWNSTDSGFVITGGGSGGVNLNGNYEKVTLLKAFEDAGIEYNTELTAAYEAFNSSYDADYSASYGSGTEAELLNPDESFYTDELMSQAREYSDTAVVVISRFQKENGGSWDSTLHQRKYNGTRLGGEWDDTRHYLETSTEEDAMLEKVYEYFGDGNVIVLLNLCNVMEVGFIDNENVDSALLIGVPGQGGANAIPSILYGDISPSGRTADTFAYDVESAPSYANSTYVSDVLGKYSVPSEYVRFEENLTYAEGIYVGYKWYETAFADKVSITRSIEENGQEVIKTYNYATEAGYQEVVQYPFGYGLSYTDFSYEIVSAPDENTILSEDGEYEIQVRVTNTGTVPGKEVVQLYYTPPYTSGGIEKSAVNLLAFGKTTTLQPANLTDDGIAESQVITLTFSSYDLASYDDYDKNGNGYSGYELEAGEYEIRIMSNAHEDAEVTNGSNSITMRSNGELLVEDPETGTTIQNRFTGNNAYADMPTDGSTVHDNITYMSRSDFEGTYPYDRQEPPTDTDAITDASEYVYTETAPETVSYDEENGLSLVLTEDGNIPTEDDLSGASGNTLVPNRELFETLLADDNAPEWNSLLSQISLQDTLDLIAQGRMQTKMVYDLGLPRVEDSDGPTGFSSLYDLSDNIVSAIFPSASTQATSWNVQNTYSVGRLQGMIANARGIGGWYAPCINIHRTPFSARNFEAYSEDAILTGVLAAETVRGAKQQNLRCFVKHFAIDDNGDNPFDYNLWASEQTIRETYLKAFEIVVKDGEANAIMSSFNRVGAVWAGANRALVTDILRDEWGFKGTVITDAAWAYMNMNRGIRAGNNLWLSSGFSTASLTTSDPYTAYMLRQSVKNIVYTYVDTYAFALDAYESGDLDDAFTVTIDKVTVSEETMHPLFILSWVAINVLFGVGLILCVLFLVLPFFKKKKEEIPEEVKDEN